MHLHNLPDFLQATVHEFWCLHPDIYQGFCELLGKRLNEVRKDQLNEFQYITDWIQKTPELRKTHAS